MPPGPDDSSVGKESACNAGDPGSIPRQGRPPGEGIDYPLQYSWEFPCGSAGKESSCNVGDPGSIPGLGRAPGEENGNPCQYSCLENPMDRGAWQATVQGVAKSWTQLSNFTSLHFVDI